jgi:hypothetical protein
MSIRSAKVVKIKQSGKILAFFMILQKEGLLNRTAPRELRAPHELRTPCEDKGSARFCAWIKASAVIKASQGDNKQKSPGARSSGADI